MNKVIIISAPSGCGKDTVVKKLNIHKDYDYAVSATTRMRRAGEIDCIDYYFIDNDDFKKKIDEDEFVEYQEVYDGIFYGTLKSEFYRLKFGDKTGLMILDAYGAMNMKKAYGEDVVTIFIMPPSIDELKARLISRGTENENDIKIRLSKADEEISISGKFDYIVVNDDLDRCVNEIHGIIKKANLHNYFKKGDTIYIGDTSYSHITDKRKEVVLSYSKNNDLFLNVPNLHGKKVTVVSEPYFLDVNPFGTVYTHEFIDVEWCSEIYTVIANCKDAHFFDKETLDKFDNETANLL